MVDTTVRLSDDMITKMRSAARAARANDEVPELAAVLDEVLSLLDDDSTQDSEYGFCVHLVGVARARGRTKSAAALKLGEFQHVDCIVPYGDVTVGELSIVPDDDITLVDIDGEPLGPRPR